MHAAERRKRWHCHPSFPLLLSLAGSLELRSNWQVYLQEFQIAVEALATAGDDVSSPSFRCSSAARRLPACIREVRFERSDDALSNFEEKFWRNGNALWALSLPGPTQ